MDAAVPVESFNMEETVKIIHERSHQTCIKQTHKEWSVLELIYTSRSIYIFIYILLEVLCLTSPKLLVCIHIAITLRSTSLQMASYQEAKSQEAEKSTSIRNKLALLLMCTKEQWVESHEILW